MTKSGVQGVTEGIRQQNAQIPVLLWALSETRGHEKIGYSRFEDYVAGELGDIGLDASRLFQHIRAMRVRAELGLGMDVEEWVLRPLTHGHMDPEAGFAPRPEIWALALELAAQDGLDAPTQTLVIQAKEAVLSPSPEVQEADEQELLQELIDAGQVGRPTPVPATDIDLPTEGTTDGLADPDEEEEWRIDEELLDELDEDVTEGEATLAPEGVVDATVISVHTEEDADEEPAATTPLPRLTATDLRLAFATLVDLAKGNPAFSPTAFPCDLDHIITTITGKIND